MLSQIYFILFFLLSRENDFHLQTNWRVHNNTITQASNGKLLLNSTYSFGKLHEVISFKLTVSRDFCEDNI